MKLIKFVSTVLTMALLLSSPSSANINADIHSSNKLLVEAHKYIKSGQIDKAFDSYQQLIEDYPHTQSAVLSVQAYSELQPSVISFGIKKDTDRYPQQSVEALLNSVVKAADSHDYGYMLAHLMGDKNRKGSNTQQKFEEIVKSVSPNGEIHARFNLFMDAIRLILKEKIPSKVYSNNGKKGVVYRASGVRLRVLLTPDNTYSLYI